MRNSLASTTRAARLGAAGLLLLAPLSGCRDDRDEASGTATSAASSTPTTTSDDTATESGSGSGGGVDCGQCVGNDYIDCSSGAPVPFDCRPGVCVAEVGCLPCSPGGTSCQGNDVVRCDEQGNPTGDVVQTCDVAGGQLCAGGACASACQTVSETPSNIGCEFWAVDLPNERGATNAWREPWGLVFANTGQATANVVVERNAALRGEPAIPVAILDLQVAPGELQTVELPTAEVTGMTSTTPDPPGPTGSAVTMNGFRVRSTAPLVVYQFNIFTNTFSNDASMLLPRQALGDVYRVLGYPTANPFWIPLPMVPQPAGLPDFTSVTIVGVEAGTEVRVRPSAPTRSDGGFFVPRTDGTGEFTVTLGPFEVLNVASEGLPSDLSGTVVEATRPVAVFTSNERGIAPSLTMPPPPPGSEPPDTCCTDHLEEQLLPITSLGRTLVIPHSANRGFGYIEADELRFMGVAAPALVTTNLPPPFDAFSLQPGEVRTTWTQGDVIVETDEPIMVSQILVSQDWTEDFIGDPSMTVFPATDQYRDDYVFLVPPSWTDNYIVVVGPAGGTYQVDGVAVNPSCRVRPSGELDGVPYESLVCPVIEGTRRINADQPFGLAVYGYGPVGSYAYVGGADVKPIYDPPPVP
jgi:hypothetical protein